MKLVKYEKADHYQLLKWLTSIHNLNLTPYQEEVIKREFYDNKPPFTLMQFDEEEHIKPWWFRLTIIFYLITMTILFISLPFTYFVKGKVGYTYEGKIAQFMINWQKKLGI